MRTQKNIKTDSSAFTVPAELSLGVLCAAVKSWGQGPAAWGPSSTQRQEEVWGAQLVSRASHANTESQSCVLGELGKPGFGRSFVWV